MWKAMESAEIGWAQKGQDPNVNHLEQRAAKLTGKEASLFVFTASLANLLALLVGTNRGDQVILDADMHLVWIEGWNLASICSLFPHLVKSDRGALPLDRVEELLQWWRGPAASHPTLIGIENPHNDHGGTITPPEHIRALAELAHANGCRVHMDGARLHNASVASGHPLIDFTQHVDTVTISVSKGLGCPVGALLCGSAADIDSARTKGLRWLGSSGMHRGGIFAAAALYAFDNMVDRLADDHRRARAIADGLSDLPGFTLNEPETNLVKVSTVPSGRLAAEYVRAAEERGLLVALREPHVFKLMTNHEVTDEHVRDAVAILGEVAHEFAGQTPQLSEAR
jgi:threonine aldolase